MESAVESPALALYNPPLVSSGLARPSARHFVSRSLHNIRQGNLALLVVFAACFVIFVRALFGAGYDEGYSAHADAANAKHPSLLSRWSPPSPHVLEEQWNKLREKRSDGETKQGLWAKIRKEDERASESTTSSSVPGSDALHWFRAMEDRALAGLGRKPAQHDQEMVQTDAEPVHAPEQAPITVPEHDISEDLDDHDAHPDDHEVPAHGHKPAAQKAPPVAVDEPVARSADEDPAAQQTSSATDEPEPSPREQVRAAKPEVDEHDDADDQPVYDSKR